MYLLKLTNERISFFFFRTVYASYNVDEAQPVIALIMQEETRTPELIIVGISYYPHRRASIKIAYSIRRVHVQSVHNV
jgi:hypothetical protein